jgi:hypothetical protein
MWSTLSTLRSVADGSKTHTSEEVIDHILGKKKKVNLISRSVYFLLFLIDFQRPSQSAEH